MMYGSGRRGSGLALQDVWQEEDSKIDIDETERRTGYSTRDDGILKRETDGISKRDDWLR